MTAYYNEFDPYAAQWLKNLIAAGHIADGEVDSRSIFDVRADDLKGFTQCHFFAGIGGWSLALRMAGWDDSRPVWTGSCPCQPFSVAGRGAGTADERHLWPTWFELIKQCRPDTIFGEQVEAAIRHGWLDLVQTDLEGVGYGIAASGIPAAGVGAPHIRQRLWFVAHSGSEGLQGAARSGSTGTQGKPGRHIAQRSGTDDWSMAYPELPNETRLGQISIPVEPEQETGRSCDANRWQIDAAIRCADGKSRPIKSSILPLAYGVSNRVGRLRAYGNAIVPQVAAEVISAYMECRP